MSTNKVWFITGASAGFGQAFAEYAIKQGDQVVVTARRLDRLEAIRASAPAQVEAVRLDVTKPQDIEKAVAQAIARFGRIDVLINNAGFALVGALEETPMDELRAQMETNFFGAVAVAQAVVPHMRAQQSGAIVSISSVAGQYSLPGFGSYSASKHALEAISEALAGEVAPFGIKVLIAEPGVFKTEIADATNFMPISDAYEPTVSDALAFVKGMMGTQEGDPVRAVEVIAQALNAEHTPLRLQLGPDAVQIIREHSAKLLQDLEEWKEVGASTSFPPEPA